MSINTLWYFYSINVKANLKDNEKIRQSSYITEREKILYALPLFVSINFIIHSNCLTDKNGTLSKHASIVMSEMWEIYFGITSEQARWRQCSRK